MKTSLLAATAILALAVAAPSYAAEGTGEPFRNNTQEAGTRVIRPAQQMADTGSSQYPNVIGRPGSNLPRLAGDVLPASGNEEVVQTANSLPTGFQAGTVTYAQAQSVHNWMVAHNQATPYNTAYTQR